MRLRSSLVRSCFCAPFLVAAMFFVPSLMADEGTAESPEKKKPETVETGSWTQWGGEDQSFKAPSGKLKNTWPEAGPPKLWERDLGEGYSSVLVQDGKLYTQYRVDEKEAVAALDAATGKTLWERRYEASPAEGHVDQFGRGPRSTPLLVDGQLFTIGVSGVLLCLNPETGEIQWQLDLWKDLGGSFLNHGYSSSPIVYGDQLFVLVGGENQAVVSLDRRDGKVNWKSLSFTNSYSTPRIFNIEDKDHMVVFMSQEIIGLDPANGELEWTYEIGNQWGQNINMPVLVDGKHLFFSTNQGGSRGFDPSRGEDGKVGFEEKWSTRKVQLYHVTSILRDDVLYASSGSRAPNFLSAINVKTGEIYWRERGFAKANLLEADGKIILLDEDGVLALLEVSPEGHKVLSKVELLERPAWTVPTLVGTTLYLRGKGKLMALDLG